MGMWKGILRFFGLGPDEEEEAEAQAGGLPQAAAAAAEPEDFDLRARRQPGAVASNVVPLQAGPKQFKVLVVEPRAFEEVQTIVDQLRQRRPVILNVEALDKEQAQRILNFLGGAIYALNGETQRVSSGIFIFAPANVDIATMGRGLTGTAMGGAEADASPAHTATGWTPGGPAATEVTAAQKPDANWRTR